jgi:uncharacterized protein YggT (Ycf19 family)
MIARYILAATATIIALIEGLLGLRILLKFLGASSQAPFVNWTYETTNPLLSPFEGIFPTSTLSGGFVLEASALFALIIYAFFGFLIESVINYLISLKPTSK